MPHQTAAIIIVPGEARVRKVAKGHVRCSLESTLNEEIILIKQQMLTPNPLETFSFLFILPSQVIFLSTFKNALLDVFQLYIL
jgi:hypothetical protein